MSLKVQGTTTAESVCGDTMDVGALSGRQVDAFVLAQVGSGAPDR